MSKKRSTIVSLFTFSKVAEIVTGVDTECENNTTATEPSASGRAQISELPVYKNGKTNMK